MIQDAPGKHEELHDMARRIAAVGCFVVLPMLSDWQRRQFGLQAGAASGGHAAPRGVVPGVQHGFVVPQRAGIYDRAAVERHWERLFSFFDRTLRQR